MTATIPTRPLCKIGVHALGAVVLIIEQNNCIAVKVTFSSFSVILIEYRKYYIVYGWKYHLHKYHVQKVRGDESSLRQLDSTCKSIQDTRGKEYHPLVTSQQLQEELCDKTGLHFYIRN